jgi:hypothetical protein
MWGIMSLILTSMVGQSYTKLDDDKETKQRAEEAWTAELEVPLTVCACA